MYAAQRASAAYRAVDLNSAPKHEIMRRLYERFFQDIIEARQAMAAKDIVRKGKAVDHAVAIVNELTASLDHSAAPEMCANLERLYRFVCERIYVASATLDPTPLDEATSVMTELAAAFREATTRR